MKELNAGGKSPQFPEIATASLSGPEAAGWVKRCAFSRAIGTKG